jgi:hypothetical protein
MNLLDKGRVVFAVAGLMLLVAGIALDSRLIVWVAIALLGLAFLLRLFLRKRGA